MKKLIKGIIIGVAISVILPIVINYYQTNFVAITAAVESPASTIQGKSKLVEVPSYSLQLSKALYPSGYKLVAADMHNIVREYFVDSTHLLIVDNAGQPLQFGPTVKGKICDSLTLETQEGLRNSGGINCVSGK